MINVKMKKQVSKTQYCNNKAKSVTEIYVKNYVLRKIEEVGMCDSFQNLSEYIPVEKKLK